MLGTKTALGIDISADRINLVLLKKGADGIELLKAVDGPVPDGAIKDGNIEDTIILTKAIKELKTHNKMRSRQTAVSLVAKPVIMQILEVPKQAPMNIGQFVRNEVRQCVALTGRDIAMDYCGIGSTARQQSRLFVTSTDSQKVSDTARACSQAGLNIGAIEPPLLAYIRALYDKKIAGKFDSNVLVAMMRGTVLNLCVFRKQNLDFVRTKDISNEKDQPDVLCQQLAEEINTIIRFYDVDVSDSSEKWEIIAVAGDSVQLPRDAQESLSANITTGDIQVRTCEDSYQDTIVAGSQNIGTDRSSPVAVGLAMKLLGAEDGVKINLLPPESAEIKSAKKNVLIAANIAAIISVLVILAVWAVTVMTKKIDQNIANMRESQNDGSIRALVKRRELVDRQISALSDRPEQVDKILSSQRDIDWPNLLDDIGRATPKNLRITSLINKADTRLFLKGLTPSYEAVRLFVSMLKKSDHIDSASLVEAEKEQAGDRLVSYEIHCSLAVQKGNISGVN